jgi:hypothetical protein
MKSGLICGYFRSLRSGLRQQQVFFMKWLPVSRQYYGSLWRNLKMKIKLNDFKAKTLK